MEGPVLCLQVLHCLLKIIHGRFVLALPLLRLLKSFKSLIIYNLFLHHHYFEGFFFLEPVLFFLLKQHVFQMCNLQVTFIINLIDSVMVKSFESLAFALGIFLLFSETIDDFP